MFLAVVPVHVCKQLRTRSDRNVFTSGAVAGTVCSKVVCARARVLHQTVIHY